MATPRLARLEVWSMLECMGGSRLAVLGTLAAVLDTRRITGDELLELTLPMLAPGYATIAERRVVRVCFTDGSFDEWWITGIEEARRESGGLEARLTCAPPLAHLGWLGPVYRLDVDNRPTYTLEALSLTIAQHLSLYILASIQGWGFTYPAAGTLDSSAPFDLAYDFTTPLAACRQLAQAAGLELAFRRNGTTGYYLDFVTAIGSSAAALHLYSGYNVRTVQRTRDGLPQATAVMMRGSQGPTGRGSLEYALWKVASAPTGTTVRLTDPLGGDGPVAFDDEFNTSRWLRKWPAGSWVQVTDSAVLNQEVTTGSAHGATAGDLVQFAQSAAGMPVQYLNHPTAWQAPPTGYGLVLKVLDRPDIPGHVNWLTNPANRLGYATGFSAVNADGTSPTLTNETGAGKFRVGGQSVKVVCTGDGQGLATDWVSIATSDAQPAYSGYWAFWNDTSGAAVRIELLLGLATVSVSSMTRAGSAAPYTATVTTGTAHGLAVGDYAEIAGANEAAYNNLWPVRQVLSATQFTFELNGTPATPATGTVTVRKVWSYPDSAQAPARGLATKTWCDLGIRNVNARTLNAAYARLRIMQNGSTSATLYVDACQLTNSGEQLVFVEGSGPVQLWQAANRYLKVYAYPPVSYELEAPDLARLGLTGADDVVLGQSITLTDTEAGFAPTTRVVELRRDLLRDAITALRLSTRPEDTTDLMARVPRAARREPSEGQLPRLAVAASFATDPANQANLFCRLSSAPLGATIYYWLGSAGQAPPRIGNITSAAPTATQWGTYSGSFSVNVGQASDNVLYAYGVLGADITDQAASWKLESRLGCSLAATLQQISGSAVRASWTPSGNTRRVRVYARRVASPGATAWPTSDGTQAAAVSETYFLQELDVSASGGGFDKNGSTVAGATLITIDQSTVIASASGAWANGDKCAVILIPRDHNGTIGTRAETSLSFVVTPPAVIGSFGLTYNADGSACAPGSGCSFTASWTEGATAWSDATHDLKIYYTIDGGSPILLTTVASPHSSSSTVVTTEIKKTTGKFDPVVQLVFYAELWDTGPTLLDSRTDSASGWGITSTCGL